MAIIRNPDEVVDTVLATEEPGYPQKFSWGEWQAIRRLMRRAVMQERSERLHPDDAS